MTHPLVVALAVVALVALLVGFLLGWLAGRKDRQAGAALRAAVNSSCHLEQIITTARTGQIGETR